MRHLLVCDLVTTGSLESMRVGRLFLHWIEIVTRDDVGFHFVTQDFVFYWITRRITRFTAPARSERLYPNQK